MAKGIVKFFDSKKGYGFIETSEGQDLFVHFSSIISDENFKDLEKFDQVEFDIEDAPRGPSAVNVRKMEEKIWIHGFYHW